MFQNYKIGILGAGNMGGAFYKGLSQKFSKSQLFLIDPDNQKLEELGAVNFFPKLSDCRERLDCLILAVKPQIFEEACQGNQEKLNKSLIISIMAGVSLAKLEKVTNSARIVRSMPNLAVTVGNSVIGWKATDSLMPQDKDFVEDIFSQFGLSLEVEKEEELNLITALSGSGPAYFFYLTEILTQKAEDFGFSTEIAQKIAEMTLIGASQLIQNNDFTAKTWKEMVTSPGGTTEAALNSLQTNNFANIFKQAIQAAKEKGEALNHL